MSNYIKEIISDLHLFLSVSPIYCSLFFFFVTFIVIFPLFLILDNLLYIYILFYGRIEINPNTKDIEKIIDNLENKEITKESMYSLLLKDKKWFHYSPINNNIADYLLKNPLLWIFFIYIISSLFFIYVYHELIMGTIPIFYILFIIIISYYIVYIKKKLSLKEQDKI